MLGHVVDALECFQQILQADLTRLASIGLLICDLAHLSEDGPMLIEEKSCSSALSNATDTGNDSRCRRLLSVEDCSNLTFTTADDDSESRARTRACSPAPHAHSRTHVHAGAETHPPAPQPSPRWHDDLGTQVTNMLTVGALNQSPPICIYNIVTPRTQGGPFTILVGVSCLLCMYLSSTCLNML